jgi:uncharacterized protein (DUF2384 family)
MNIDDFLKTERFKELDSFLNSEMKKYAGEDLTYKMNSVFGTPENSRDWFYTNLIALGGKRPYDYCKELNTQKVKEILEGIEHGIIQ